MLTDTPEHIAEFGYENPAALDVVTVGGAMALFMAWQPGAQLLEFMDVQGIDRSHVRIDLEHPTGFMLKSLELDGSDPRIEYFRSQSAASHLSAADNPTTYCAASRHLYLTGISPALSRGVNELVTKMALQARLEGRSFSFDPNLRPRLWASQVVVKLGADGAYIASRSGCATVPGVPVSKIVDTVGAGDGLPDRAQLAEVMGPVLAPV